MSDTKSGRAELGTKLGMELVVQPTANGPPPPMWVAELELELDRESRTLRAGVLDTLDEVSEFVITVSTWIGSTAGRST